MNHDVIVIGASAGGLDVLLDTARRLPADLPASLFVVVHTSPSHPSHLPELLSERGPLPASHPVDGEKIARGHIYVAPPDNHLVLRPGWVEVARGPKENGHRPSVDALFRTASSAYGPRVVGVVLSGHQDCGTAGVMSIKARGGVTVVQSPDSAAVPEMPRSVLERGGADFVVQPLELPDVLARLTGAPAGPALAPDEAIQRLEGDRPGEAAELVCPLCQGVLTESARGAFNHFRCHVGHAFSLESLVREQGEALERALWAAVRSLEESAALSKRLSATESGELRHRFAEKARTQLQQADLIREILLHGNKLTSADGPKP
jgi:two-component system chemotaxis response regulator CheB